MTHRPFPLETEMRVLGACMSSINWLNEVMAKLKPEYLISSESRLIFDCMRDLYQNDREVTFDTIHARIEGKQAPIEFLMRLLDLSHAGFMLNDLLAELHQGYHKRQLAEMGKQLNEHALKPEISATDLIREMEEKLFSLTQLNSTKILRTLKEIANDPISFAEVLQQRQEKFSQGISSFEGFPTSFIDLDKYLKGLVKGHFTIIGARPGVGKTSFVLNLIENLCLKHKIPALFFSLEMPAREIVEKLLAQSSEVPFQKVATGSLNGLEFQTIYQCLRAWENRSLVIDDQPSLGIDQIKARAIRAKRTHQIQIIFIDYVQLITSTRGSEARHLEIGDISRRLKEIAKELDVPVVALAQLNREVEKRSDKKPLVSDLRESGSLEADADEIILLHRPELYDKYEKPGLMQVCIAKNRFGATGIFEMVFVKETGKIKDYDPRFQPS